MENKSTTFGERLRAAREKAGFSGPAMAEKIGIKYPTYMRYENKNSEPRQETLVKIAKFLGTTTDYLLGLDDSEQENDLQPLIDRLRDALKRPETNYDGHLIEKEERKQIIEAINKIQLDAAMDFFS